jgi:hypothetical protein
MVRIKDTIVEDARGNNINEIRKHRSGAGNTVIEKRQT